MIGIGLLPRSGAAAATLHDDNAGGPEESPYPGSASSGGAAGPHGTVTTPEGGARKRTRPGGPMA